MAWRASNGVGAGQSGAQRGTAGHSGAMTHGDPRGAAQCSAGAGAGAGVWGGTRGPRLDVTTGDHLPGPHPFIH